MASISAGVCAAVVLVTGAASVAAASPDASALGVPTSSRGASPTAPTQTPPGATMTAGSDGTPVTLGSAAPAADGRSVRVSFTGTVATGPCADTYTASAIDEVSRVRVTVRATRPANPRHVLCSMIAIVHTLVVPLSAPLDGRPVVDGATGEPAPAAPVLPALLPA